MNDSAQPGPRKRKPRKPGKNRSTEQSISLIVTADGKFAPADGHSKKICRDRGMKVGSEFIAYLYEPRDLKQWRKAHALANLLQQNVEELHGMKAHAILKKLQLDGNIATDEETINLGTLGVFKRSVPQSLAFGSMDETKFTEVYAAMCEYVGRKYFGEIDADAVEEMIKLMEKEPSA